MKIIFVAFIFIFSSACYSSNECASLSCADTNFTRNNFEKYNEILYQTIDSATGCKNRNKLQELLEYSKNVIGHIYSEEVLTEFIENEFIKALNVFLKKCGRYQISPRK